MSTGCKRVDLIIPVYNEESVVQTFHSQLSAAIDPLSYQFSILYINDGSTDGTMDRLEGIVAQDQRVTVLELSRNFGHQAALTAGLDHSGGDFTISLDGDGQHPPLMIAEMLKLAESGYDVVLTQRLEQEGLGFFKRSSSYLFYRLVNTIGNTRIIPGGADFRLLTRSAREGLCQMREYHHFLRGMVAWAGYKTVILPFPPAPRLGGKSKYSLSKMLRLGMDAVFSFSLVPIYISIIIGVLFLFGALAEMVYVLSFWMSGNTSQLAPGWSSLMFVLLIVGGSLMVTVGMTGLYIGFIFQQTKWRPIYLLRRVLGVQPTTPKEPRG
jgi:glycosyltransferase involved in cell wall biosynthesis